MSQTLDSIDQKISHSQPLQKVASLEFNSRSQELAVLPVSKISLKFQTDL